MLNIRKSTFTELERTYHVPLCSNSLRYRSLISVLSYSDKLRSHLEFLPLQQTFQYVLHLHYTVHSTYAHTHGGTIAEKGHQNYRVFVLLKHSPLIGKNKKLLLVSFSTVLGLLVSHQDTTFKNLKVSS